MLRAVEPVADESPPAAPPAGTKSALAFFLVLLGLFPFALLAQWASAPLGLAATQLFAFLLPAVVATVGSNLRPRAYLRLRAPGLAPVVLGALTGAAAYMVAGAVMSATQRLLPEGWVKLFDVARIFEGPAWERAALSVLAVAVAPACEELAFRGYLQTTLSLRRSPAGAIAAGAALFATLHLDPVRFPALVVLGLVFGWLTWRAGSIWPSVAAHAANNGIAMALLLTVGEPEGAPPPAGAIAAMLAFGVTSLVALGLAYRAVTPRPPPVSDALELRDPASPSIAWHPARVPPPLARAAAGGLAILFLLAVAGLAASLTRGR
jgi:membrane protease YdiL (CAAX protease family)